jgi:hypothetical protein
MAQAALNKQPVFDGLYPIEEIFTEEEAAAREAARKNPDQVRANSLRTHLDRLRN